MQHIIRADHDLNLIKIFSQYILISLYASHLKIVDPNMKVE